MDNAAPDIIERLTRVLGNEGLITDPEERDYYSQDVFSSAEYVTSAVLRPANIEELSEAVRIATEAGYAVFPRGGGMSYTSGYLPTAEKSVTVDLARMNNIREINLEDMYITVECGCSWVDIYEALQGKGVRPPFWGTLSGIKATVGGGLSQNCIFFGSGIHGSGADTVIGLEVVLADGTVINTGSGAIEGGTPFFRHYGPDLTGVFTADTGALGIKAVATLKLIASPPFVRHLSFDFPDHKTWLPAMGEISRKGLASECFGFDPYLQMQSLKRGGFSQDIKALAGVMQQAGSIGKAMLEGAKVALAGRRYMKDVTFSCHVTTEHRYEAATEAAEAEIREILTSAGGREIENSIPKLVRGTPFPPTNAVIGPDGERWVPIHTVVPHSKAVSTFEAIENLYAEMAEKIEKYHIGAGYLVTTIGASAMVLEPVFFWPDALMPFHKREVEAPVLRKAKGFPENLEARATVDEIRKALAKLFLELGTVHLQIGKAYLYSEGLKPASLALVQEIKKAVDPRGLMNPGSLGLARPGLARPKS